MDLKKIQIIVDWEPPSCVKEVQAFEGFANFYRRFIKELPKVVATLTQVAKKVVPFQCKEAQQRALEELKRRFI